MIDHETYVEPYNHRLNFTSKTRNGDPKHREMGQSEQWTIGTVVSRNDGQSQRDQSQHS